MAANNSDQQELIKNIYLWGVNELNTAPLSEAPSLVASVVADMVSNITNGGNYNDPRQYLHEEVNRRREIHNKGVPDVAQFSTQEGPDPNSQ